MAQHHSPRASAAMACLALDFAEAAAAARRLGQTVTKMSAAILAADLDAAERNISTHG
jgi:hypothetical protein